MKLDSTERSIYDERSMKNLWGYKFQSEKNEGKENQGVIEPDTSNTG